MEVIAASAPELQVAQWFNTDAPVTLAGLRGKVVLVYAFQMLCPGCVTHTIPQAEPPRLSRRQLRLSHAAISRFSLAA